MNIVVPQSEKFVTLFQTRRCEEERLEYETSVRLNPH